MNDSKPLILVLDKAGIPRKWIDFEKAAYYHCKGLISWSAGQNEITIHGGISKITGKQSHLAINSIISLSGARVGRRTVPAISNHVLFRRDGNQCTYCGDYFSKNVLTRDHFIAKANGGLDLWNNVVTSCRSCNNRKGHRPISDYIDDVVFKPHTPNLSEYLLLLNRAVLDDQYDFLIKQLPKESRYADIYPRPLSPVSGSVHARTIEYDND